MKRKISWISIWIAIVLLAAARTAMVGCKSSQEDKKKKESIPLTIEVYDRNAVRTVEYGSVSDNRWTEQIKKRVNTIKCIMAKEVHFDAVSVQLLMRITRKVMKQRDFYCKCSRSLFFSAYCK